MKIIHNISSIDQTYGGPLFSMKLIAESQHKLGHNVAIISSIRNKEDSRIEINKDIRLITPPSFSKFRYSKNWENLLIKEFGLPEIIHTYGTWTYHNLIASIIAKKYNIPHIIAPCGMLYKAGIKNNNMTPKKALWTLFQKKALFNADIIHAKSNAECDNIKLIPNVNISKINVVPNPIEPLKSDKTNYDLGLNKIWKTKKYIVYVGRLDSRKGLLCLINTWNQIVKGHDDWRLVITGSDGNSGYLNDIKINLKKSKNINFYDYLCDDNDFDKFQDSNLVLTGPLYGSDKNEIYKNASIFINPSNYENFGMTIAEALNHNLPVIISKNTPWDSVESKNCGWLLSDKNANLKEILNSALMKSSKELRRFGKNSSNFVKNLSPDKIAMRHIENYRKLIKQNNKNTKIAES
jgi:glycosyltransferase involved in cell wall biosynthesis